MGEILEEIADNQHCDKPIDVCDKANAEAKQEISEIEWVPDVTIGTGCDEVAGGTERSCSRGCACISDCHILRNSPATMNAPPHNYGIPRGFCEIEQCENKRNRGETTDFEEEVTNF